MTGTETFPLIERPVEGRFLARLNRFACRVRLASGQTVVYLPNSGRLEELLQPGARILLEKRREGGKTQHDLLLVQTLGYPHGEPIWAGVDSRLPPKLIAWSLKHHPMEVFHGAKLLATEPRVGDGRLDLLLASDEGETYVESKSVNLVDLDGTARFPDAPTSRGRRHVTKLIELQGEGFGAALIFVVMRSDAKRLAPFIERDREFAAALRNAVASGVRVEAVQFQAGPSMRPLGSLPVVPSPPAFPGFWPPDGRTTPEAGTAAGAELL